MLAPGCFLLRKKRRLLQFASFCFGQATMCKILVAIFVKKGRENGGSVIFHKNIHFAKMNFYSAALAFFALS